MKRNKICTQAVIAVTGGMGCGKSTVAKILEGFGATRIDCDAIAREISEQADVLEALAQTFGKDILEAGRLMRKKLAAIVFSDPQKLALLNGLIHARVRSVVKTRLLSGKSGEIFVLDIPLPTHEGYLEHCDSIWVVVASLQTRLDRIKSRDGLTEEEIHQRIAAQPPMEAYQRIGDIILENDAAKETLKLHVQHHWCEFLKKWKEGCG